MEIDIIQQAIDQNKEKYASEGVALEQQSVVVGDSFEVVVAQTVSELERMTEGNVTSKSASIGRSNNQVDVRVTYQVRDFIQIPDRKDIQSGLQGAVGVDILSVEVERGQIDVFYR